MTAHSHSRSTLRLVGETVAVSFPPFDPNSGVIRVKAVQLLLQCGSGCNGRSFQRGTLSTPPCSERASVRLMGM